VHKRHSVSGANAVLWFGCVRCRYYLGMSLNVAASLADIVDGPIARSTPGRHPAFAVVGSKLDCYSDIVSHFVVPASLLMHISDLNAFCTALAALYVCAGILRHVSAFLLISATPWKQT